jgi:hypothetical protein
LFKKNLYELNAEAYPTFDDLIKQINKTRNKITDKEIKRIYTFLYEMIAEYFSNNGIYAQLYNGKSTLTIGDNSDEVSITNPSIRGSSSGLTTNNNKVYFYDGILKGKTNAVDHPANLHLPDDHILLDKEETIDWLSPKSKYISSNIGSIASLSTLTSKPH